MKMALIDYGAGNVTSVERALGRLGVESQRCETAESLSQATALLLPGVGHYGALVRAIDERGLRAPLLDAISRGVPFLGICLGLQALYESSEEAPELRGLGILPDCVSALPANVKLPHMGWNQLRHKSFSRLLDGIEEQAYFYFAHSFAASLQNGETVATCMHGKEFAAVVEQKNIFAVQFHPEKSGAAGERLLQNFLRIAA